MNSFQIRQKFLEFFARHNHTIVPSSPLIPAEDPTILFTNAGMNQFKDVFLGKEKRSYVRATSSQKCVRAGGKHNDLDAVGFTERHLTFFEMLGNFSFGDYFKDDAIAFAWEFLTQDIKLDPSKLYISVFREDDQAYDIWHKKIGLAPDHIIRLNEKDNFWQMGDTGPCGPCTEIYVDRGADRGCKQPGCAPGCDCSRFTEIWNLVFMQYDRQPSGELVPLKQTGVDTGMGLERLCMILEGTHTVYDTDVFRHLISIIEKLTGKTYATADASTQAAFRVLCDHVRSSSLLIADGCTPANDGRGYVLRKIIRRAALFTQKLSPTLETFTKLSDSFIEHMAPVFPELQSARTLILNLLADELKRFENNLMQGQNILERYIQENRAKNSTILSGEQIFKLYDTYGFPPELTRVLANERNLHLDMDGFEAHMTQQQEQSGKKVKGTTAEFVVADNITTTFVGYETTQHQSPISFVHNAGDHLWIITESSPFYVECGGQVSDSGHVTINSATYPLLELKKVGQTHSPAIAIKLEIPANATPVNEGDIADCWVDPVKRANTVKNHTATHMLQAALLQVLGSGVKQAGSLVCPEYLRFDFTHHEALSKEQIEHIETILNEKIVENIQTNIFNTTLADAKTKGIISFFGEKYNPENVRVVQIPGFSAELCGGTHASATGIIGCFKIVSDSALSTGTRRMVAVTGPEALRLFQQSFASVKKLSETFKVKPDEVVTAVEKVQNDLAHAQTAIKQLKKQLQQTQLPTWLAQMTTVGELPFLCLTLDDADAEQLRTIAQSLEKSKPGFYFLASHDKVAGRASFIAYLAKGFESKVDLKKLSAFLKERFDWRGGGSGNAAQGGGTSMPKDLCQQITAWLKQ
jgi:alanyl-tRNA synthetase